MAFSELPSPPRPSGFDTQERGKPPSLFRLLFVTILPFVLSALWAAVVVRLIARDPTYAIPIVALALLWIVPLGVARARQRRMLRRGNVPEVLEAWAPMLRTTPYPETVQPLLLATAYAANGWVDHARESLRRARKGEAWAAAEEQRSIIDTLLEAFDGDRTRAVRLAEELVALPLPAASVFVRRRVAALRAGLAALARAFARVPLPHDRRTLVAAADASPLFHWAFSYAAAITAIDEGDADAARRAIRGAPRWPEPSVFRGFHAELEDQLARLDALAD